MDASRNTETDSTSAVVPFDVFRVMVKVTKKACVQ